MNQSKMWLKGILNSATDAIIGIDNNSNILFMNTKAQQIVGIEEQKAIGNPAYRVVQFKDKKEIELFDFIDDCYKESTAIEYQLFNRVTKEYVHVSGNITSVRDSENNFSGVVLTLTDTGEMKELVKRVKFQSSHDNLTNLMNRISFIEYVDSLINISKKDKSTHGFLAISIDRFKVVNDTCGHMAGDELLRNISYRIKDCDINNEFIIGRIGGDEFGVLFKNSSLTTIKHYTKSIKRSISKNDFIWGEKECPIYCSYGIVTIDENTTDHHSLFAAIDDSCAIAKENGGNRIEIYNGADNKYNRRRGEMEWIHKLKDAISNDRFVLYYQEILAVEKSSSKKLEILVRLKDENGNIIQPSDFIPSAERYGIMPIIDKIIIEKSIAACRKLIDEKGIDDNVIFSVNISGTSIPDKSLPTFIFHTFQKYKVPPTLFCFEITETATIGNLDSARKFIDSLKRVGCRFSLDDFGSGFSNFTYLKNLDIDYLKIDGSFIENMLDDPINRAMVESINNIGHSMKMKTVAEFVSSKGLQEELIELGIDYLQGYNICKPTPIENLIKQ